MLCYDCFFSYCFKVFLFMNIVQSVFSHKLVIWKSLFVKFLFKCFAHLKKNGFFVFLLLICRCSFYILNMSHLSIAYIVFFSVCGLLIHFINDVFWPTILVFNEVWFIYFSFLVSAFHVLGLYLSYLPWNFFILNFHTVKFTLFQQMCRTVFSQQSR